MLPGVFGQGSGAGRNVSDYPEASSLHSKPGTSGGGKMLFHQGHYYESLVHFAFAELGKVEVALYSEPIPKVPLGGSLVPMVKRDHII